MVTYVIHILKEVLLKIFLRKNIYDHLENQSRGHTPNFEIVLNRNFEAQIETYLVLNCIDLIISAFSLS